METQITNVIQAFQNSKQYVIPSYQRNYVWTREGQWDPLWEDVKALVARHLKDGVEIEPHFLGTIITKVIDMDDGHISRSWVVDGQQRLTTLQVLLAAARATFIDRGLNQLAGVLSGCLVNDEDLVIRPKDRYKIDHKGGDGDEQPGDQQSDYRRFTSIVDAALSSHESPADGSPLSECYAFYRHAVRSWLPPGSDRDAQAHANALTKVMRQKLRVVDIRLGGSENPHAIFEALNARGEPLTEWEKTKNYILSIAAGGPGDPDGDNTYRTHLRRYDIDAYWSEIVHVPRFSGKRIDLFLFYFSQIELPLRRRTITGETTFRLLSRRSLYRDFRYVGEHHYRHGDKLHAMLERLGKYATIYRSIDRQEGYSSYSLSVMRRRHLLNLNSLVPVFMELVAKLGRRKKLDRVLRIVDSYLMRRVALKARYSGFDDIAFGHVQAIRDADRDEIPKVLLGRLLKSRWPDRWPGDDEIRSHFVNGNMYDGISKARLKLLLRRIAREMHDEKRPKLANPFGLDASVNIEHVAPQNWERHWQTDLGVGTNEEERWRLHQIVHRIGNLTLVTHPMNTTLGDRPWSFKAGLLRADDNLEMNRRLLRDMQGDVWNQDEIERRGRQLAEYVVRIWPHAEGLTKELGITMPEVESDS